ncbi:MAG TPA: porin [Xanthomonadales bacterium]|nr:porin [Xanthomonadales bacterium]
MLAVASTPIHSVQSTSPPAATQQLSDGTQAATVSPDEPAAAADNNLDKYVLADLPPDTLVYDGERFQIRPIIAVVGDYTFFDQDAPSLEQVGEQEDTPDLRAARFGMYLRPKTGRAWEFFVAVDYQERRRREDASFQLYDLRFRVPIGRVNLDIGKQKQPFSFEVSGLSILYPNQERILSPFFVTRSNGIKASGQMAGDRMTWSAGWFNDWLEQNSTFTETGDDYVARITGLAWASETNNNYLHIGLGFRQAGPDSGICRMSGRPESNVADKYVDTGDFEADYVNQYGIDLAWQQGPLLLMAEHMEARARAPQLRNPRFSGNYLMLSWMLTGESRPYLRAAGSFGPVTPSSHNGAFELVTRYSHIDLSDGLVQGGVLNKWHFGFNWWISRQWKAGLSWGDADLDRNDLKGNTTLLLLRSQWFY